MNPFDLPGPQFLAFYVVFSVAVMILTAILRRISEPAATGLPPSALTDPYLIAFLRGGKNELIRTAIISLVDRGLLEVHGESVQTSAVGAKATVRKPIEVALLRACGASVEAASLFSDKSIEATTAEYEQKLKAERLLPNEEIQSRRGKIFGFAAAVLLIVSIAKIAIAISRGRYNFIFLIFLTVVALILAAVVAFPRLTAAGKKYVAEVRNLFESLRLRSAQLHPGGSTAEIALLVAVFGVPALAGDEFAWSKTLFPKAAAQSGTAATSSCGSSCGSSSSCGGGGGCGGGCGGCGG